MDAFLRVKASKNKLRMANNVRMWLRVITISDLADAGGTRIPANRLGGSWRADSSLSWPDLPAPTEKMWTAFRFFLRKTFCVRPARVLRTQPMILDTALGHWYKRQSHLTHDMYRTLEHLYIRREGRDILADGNFVRFDIQHNMGNRFRTSGNTVTMPPPHAIPVGAYCRPGRTFAYPLNEYTALDPPTPQTASPATETERLDRLVSSDRATGVSDGSLDPVSGKAAFAWVLALPDRTAWVKRSTPVRSNPRYISSYRVELAGMCDLLEYILENDLGHIVIDLWCDNKAVVDLLMRPDPYSLTDLDSAESDLTQKATDILAKLPNVTLQHVHGHQDDDIAYDDLPFEAQLNVDCDVAAGTCASTMTPADAPPTPVRGSRAMLYLGNDMVTTEMEEQIQYKAHSNALRSYTIGKFEWTQTQYDSVNWRALGLAKQRLTMTKNVQISKMMHHWLNVGKQKLLFEQILDNGKCPCCGTAEEDQEHLYTCDHPDMRSTLEAGITAIVEACYNANIPKGVSRAFVDNIRRATKSTRPPERWTCEDATIAAELQDSLGTFAILRGHHHADWVRTIKETYRPRQPPPGSKPRRDRSPLDMAALMIEEVWNLFHSLWDMRISILHGNDGFSARHEASQATQQLITYRTNR